MLRILLFAALILTISACHGLKQSSKPAEVKLTNLYDSASYAWGLNIGEFLKGYYYSDLNLDLMRIGLEQSLHNQSVLMSTEQVKTLVREYGQLIIEELGAKNDSIDHVVLLENAKNPEVISLPSGLQYQVISDGWGETYPTKGDRLIVHYDCWLFNGKKVDSSIDRMKPYEFVVGLEQVIPAWEEIALLMKEGDKFKIWVPSKLAYGYTTSIPNIPPGSALIYEMKILEIKAIKSQPIPQQ